MRLIQDVLREVFAKNNSWEYRRYRLIELFEFVCAWVGLGTILYWLGKGGWALFTHFFVITVR